ncbi:unnamed protein product [Darwinula stevensoni]|uniref:Transmembrane protein 5 n=1 Tax=Darwinula stevensoni TaxID=69355 RepID=A0A7R9A6I5_9CRUS|nr:unnamed protein product [Darwinula stevensoni]CAG0889303.1 unnamed protein product [Darwinula stevensoni]
MRGLLPWSVGGVVAVLVAALVWKEPECVEDAGVAPRPRPPVDVVTEIWGKAAIGHFLWEHVLNASLEEREDGLWTFGARGFGRDLLKFRSGPKVIPGHVPVHAVERLVLVLNGRTEEKREAARRWLSFLESLPNLKRTGAVVLGNESCENSWLAPHLRSNGGRLDFVFLVYDSRMVDGESVFQWPLGVATYRGFPKRCISSGEQLERRRKFFANFIGTVYENSSREVLVEVASESPEDVFLHIRENWEPEESEETLTLYVKTLQSSHLTLCPSGTNPESYRIYEALSCGSIPVVEDPRPGGDCDDSPLRLLKAHGAPVVWIRDWRRLPDLFGRERLKSEERRREDRRRVYSWYRGFLSRMKACLSGFWSLRAGQHWGMPAWPEARKGIEEGVLLGHGGGQVGSASARVVVQPVALIGPGPDLGFRLLDQAEAPPNASH